uniref:Uncharacterized protein n=1 Tax=Rhizophora mucronata TaxID=61149 RepID=A0A2P2R0C4_RHIMU
MHISSHPFSREPDIILLHKHGEILTDAIHSVAQYPIMETVFKVHPGAANTFVHIMEVHGDASVLG